MRRDGDQTECGGVVYLVVPHQCASKDLIFSLQYLHHPSCPLPAAVWFLSLLKGCIEEFRA